MKSFVKIALFAIVATNAIRVTKDDPAEEVTKAKTSDGSSVEKFAYQMAGPDAKSRSDKISEAW